MLSSTVNRIDRSPSPTVKAVNGSSITVIGSAGLTVSTGTWYTLRIEVNGTTVRGFVNGAQIASGTNSAYGAGRIALVTTSCSPHCPT